MKELNELESIRGLLFVSWFSDFKNLTYKQNKVTGWIKSNHDPIILNVSRIMCEYTHKAVAFSVELRFNERIEPESVKNIYQYLTDNVGETDVSTLEHLRL